MGGSADNPSDGEGNGPEPTAAQPSSPAAEAAAADVGGDDRQRRREGAPAHPPTATLTPLMDGTTSNAATLPRSNTTTPSGGAVVHCDPGGSASGGSLVELTSLFAPCFESTDTLRAGNLSPDHKSPRPRHSPSSSSERLIEMSEMSVRGGYHALDTLKMNNRKSFVGIGLVEIEESPEVESPDRTGWSMSRQSTLRHSNAEYERVNSRESTESADDEPALTDSPLYKSEASALEGCGDGPLHPVPETDDPLPRGLEAITDRLFPRNEHLRRSASRLGESAERIGNKSRTVWGLMTKRLSTVGRKGSVESDLGSIREEEDDEDDDPVSYSWGFSLPSVFCC